MNLGWREMDPVWSPDLSCCKSKAFSPGSPKVLSMEVGSSGFGGVAQEALWGHIPVELGHFLEFAQDGFTAN